MTFSPAPEPESPRDPLILVEDPLTRGHEWSQLRPLLEPAFRVRSLPMRAFDADAGPFPPGPVVELLEKDVEEGGWYPCHVVASKLGCAAAIRLATGRPDLVRSLVLHDPILSTDPEPSSIASVSERLFDLAEALAGNRVEPANREWGRLLGDPSPSRSSALVERERTPGELAQVAELLRSPRAWRVPSPLDEFLGPVLILDGDGSPPFIRAAGDRLASRLPNVVRLTLHDAGALLPVDDPARFAAVVMSFCLERTVPTS